MRKKKKKPGRPALFKKTIKVRIPKITKTQKECNLLYAQISALSQALSAQDKAILVFEKFEAMLFNMHERLKGLEDKINQKEKTPCESSDS